MAKFRVVWDERTTVEVSLHAGSAVDALATALECGHETEIDGGPIPGTARVDDALGNVVIEPAGQRFEDAAFKAEAVKLLAETFPWLTEADGDVEGADCVAKVEELYEQMGGKRK